MSRRHTLFLTCILLISIYSFLKLPPYIPSLTSPNPHLPPTNSTLGFGTILAVSRKQSPRKPSLLWAANLIDLNIVIPEQPDWTFGDIQGFRAKQGSTISNGSALAWLGHLHALQRYVCVSSSSILRSCSEKLHRYNNLSNLANQLPHHPPRNSTHPRRRHRFLPLHPTHANPAPRIRHALPAHVPIFLFHIPRHQTPTPLPIY